MVSARKASGAPHGGRATSSKHPTASSSSPAPIPATPHGRQPPPLSASASSSKEGMRTRQKRVLPTRSRRGGPGVGTCESDVMILETMKRKADGEPLIPSTTRFLLTTNAKLLPSVSETETPEAQLNTHAYGRYFDRPEVQRAYKAQQLIQTPEFTELAQDANVGGRFRPRGSEDEAVDTSDATYEKRHRKYETLEKRQRLREKEKLKHEHYKLKERIDQLRAMDSSAFLILPAADFSAARDGTPGPPDVPDDEQLLDMSNLHGAAAYHEGERRRKEMLETALQLEQRYRTLLPPDKPWVKKSDRPEYQAVSADVVEEDAGGSEDEEEVDELEDDDDEEAPANGEREADDPDPSEDDGESEIDPEELERERSKKLKLRIKFPPRMLANKQSAHESKPPPSRGGGKQITLSPFFKPYASGGKGPLNSPLRSASYATSETTSKRGRHSVDTADSLHQAPSAKRQRVQTAASARGKGSKTQNGIGVSESISSSGLAGKKEPTTCVLMVAAVRLSAAPTARKTQRHVTAFGVRVPPELEEVRDFEIPEWVLVPPGSASDDGDRQQSYEASYGYSRGRSDGGYSASVGDRDDATDYGT
ncbi:hypothetical protein C8Q78DRAFT_650187 [Trametes maxima]|nr:hypothetical protein C8Q78DRAFT_650187 [Trametes maxima]